MTLTNKITGFFLLALLMFWFLGFISINLYHHLELPKEVLNRNTVEISTKLSFSYPFVATRTDIYMVDEIKTYKQTEDIIIALNQAKYGDQVVLHLAGVGGGVEQVQRIINAIRSSKGKVSGIVEAPVYSGHAYLALSVDDLTVRPFSYLMMHTSSGYGMDCSKYRDKPMDRSQTAEETCQQYLYNHLLLTAQVVQSLYVLTDADKEAIINGKTIYVTNTYNRNLSCIKGKCRINE